tara:strand:- start:10759 stop:11457 length:699 start_codon:yes stop_codon:yes gene_type:complete
MTETASMPPTAKTSNKAIKLNTTAYCLLGLISLRPQSAYELTKFLERSLLRYSLPRSPSQLYNEPKKLAEKGLVKATSGRRQGRERTDYSITEAGSKALTEWLTEPGEPAKLEFKSMLKFYLAGATDRQALKDRVEEIKQQTFQEIRDIHDQIERFTEKGVRLKEIAVNAAMASRFGVAQIKARLAWVKEMEVMLQRDRSVRSLQSENNAMKIYQTSLLDLKELIDEYNIAP